MAALAHSFYQPFPAAAAPQLVGWPWRLPSVGGPYAKGPGSGPGTGATSAAHRDAEPAVARKQFAPMSVFHVYVVS